MELDRRDFLKTSLAAGAAGLATTGGLLGTLMAAETAQAPGVPAGSSSRAVAPAATATQPVERRGDMPYRMLGRTGEKVSIIGLGGWHFGAAATKQDAIRLLRTAVERGINFMDNCWDYHAGKSEEWMGDALQDGYRDKVYLMTKIDGRTKKAAAQQIDESLKRLKTDRVDLMQIHEVIRLEDPDRCFGEDGAMEALLAAQKAGKVRHIGFTGHKDPYVHLRMVQTGKDHGFVFDAAQMPLSVMDAHFRSFEKDVLPMHRKDGTGVLAMKTLSGGAILRTNLVKPIECLHYAMTLGVSTVITGMENMQRLEQGLEAARTFRPLSREQIAALLARTREAARTGRHERFKTATDFDGTTHHPEWMG